MNNEPEIKGSNPGSAQYHGKRAQQKKVEITLPNGNITVVEQLDNDPEIEGQKPDATQHQERVAEEKILEIDNQMAVAQW